ncbi:hypothetical protein GCM10009540_80330 [Streptomyces turgidiscabies]
MTPVTSTGTSLSLRPSAPRGRSNGRADKEERLGGDSLDTASRNFRLPPGKGGAEATQAQQCMDMGCVTTEAVRDTP